MSDRRTGHPFYLYESIEQQPGLVERMLRDGSELVAEAARAAAQKERLWLAGIGSSLYTAEMAEHFLRHLTAGHAAVRAVESFEFVKYPPAITPRDAVVVLSHTGTTTFSLEALALARGANALTIAVCGENCGPAMRAADFLMTTCEQEVSFAYTKSLTSALARLAIFCAFYARARREAGPDARGLLETVPGLMRRALSSEPQIRDLAQQIAGRDRTMLFGTGPNWATAREIALKIKETSFQPAEGEESEQFLHGPFSEVDERMTAIALLAGGPGDTRTRTILRAAGEAGARTIAVHVPGARPELPAEARIEVPGIEEWLSPFVFLVPLQLLTYHLALARGTNPDCGRQDQPLHAQARKLYTY